MLCFVAYKLGVDIHLEIVKPHPTILDLNTYNQKVCGPRDRQNCHWLEAKYLALISSKLNCFFFILRDWYRARPFGIPHSPFGSSPFSSSRLEKICERPPKGMLAKGKGARTGPLLSMAHFRAYEWKWLRGLIRTVRPSRMGAQWCWHMSTRWQWPSRDAWWDHAQPHW